MDYSLAATALVRCIAQLNILKLAYWCAEALKSSLVSLVCFIQCASSTGVFQRFLVYFVSLSSIN